MDIVTSKDGNLYLAEIEGIDNFYAYGKNKLDAQKELLGVTDMMLDLNKKFAI